MSVTYEVHPDLEEVGMDAEAGLTSMYDGLFNEADFRALGLNPSAATEAKPGSDDKVVMLAARYAAGLPLWHNNDRYDHSPVGEENDDQE